MDTLAHSGNPQRETPPLHSQDNMPTEPLVSIVMPCFNAEAHLERSIGSVLAQAFTHWELIAIDDGSRDGTLAQLQRFQDGRIRVIGQSNMGVSGARNTGLKQCTGDYIAFLDADDTWSPRFLQTMVCKLESAPDTVLAYCGWQNLGIEDNRGEPFVPPDYEGPGKTLALLQGCRWPIHASLTRRGAIECAGGFETSLRIGEDYLLWMEVAAQGPIVRVQEVLAFYHHHEGPQATDNRALAALDTLKAKQIFTARHPDLVRKVGRTQVNAAVWTPVINQASELYWGGNLEGARPLFRRALLAGQGSMKDKVRMLPSLLPLWLHRLAVRLLTR